MGLGWVGKKRKPGSKSPSRLKMAMWLHDPLVLSPSSEHSVSGKTCDSWRMSINRRSGWKKLG